MSTGTGIVVGATKLIKPDAKRAVRTPGLVSHASSTKPLNNRAVFQPVSPVISRHRVGQDDGSRKSDDVYVATGAIGYNAYHRQSTAGDRDAEGAAHAVNGPLENHPSTIGSPRTAISVPKSQESAAFMSRSTTRSSAFSRAVRAAKRRRVEFQPDHPSGSQPVTTAVPAALQ